MKEKLLDKAVRGKLINSKVYFVHGLDSYKKIFDSDVLVGKIKKLSISNRGFVLTVAYGDSEDFFDVYTVDEQLEKKLFFTRAKAESALKRLK